MLTTTRLIAGYDGTPVSSLPDLDLGPGQSCLLKGRSGSGKTTILHTIGGLLRPISGSVKVGEHKVDEMSEAERDRFRGQKIGIVFQTLHLIKSLTILQNIMLAPAMANTLQNSEQALLLLDKLGIKDLADKPATSLSQGQAQRVAIARAIINEPAIILADEPTSSLDDESCTQTITLLHNLSREAKAVLIVSSHDARISSSFSQTITLGT